MLRSKIVACVVFASLFIVVGVARAADDPGQEDLDKAIESKISAMSLRDYEQVTKLCESALKKGLGESSAKFCKQLLTSTLYEIASRICQPIFEAKTADQRWPLFRREALPLLEKIIQHDPLFDEAYYLIARLQSLPGGDRKKALDAVGKAVKLAGDDKTKLSRSLLLRGNLAEDENRKLADYNQAVIIDPKNKDALRTRGLYLLGKGKTEQAVQDLVKLVEVDEGNAIAHHALAEAYTNLEQYDKALEALEQAAKLDPKSALTYTLRARLHAIKEDTKSALEDLDKSLELQPRNVGALIMRARILMADEKVEEAKKDVDKALVIQPGLVQGILLRAMIAGSEGKFSDAASDLEKLSRGQPDNLGWKLQLAAYYQADKRPRKAIKLLDEILKDDPQTMLALRARGDALLSVGRHADAVKDYNQALKIDPKHSGILNNLAWVLATSPNDNVRDGKRSIALGKRACEATEYKKPHILSTLASGYAEAGDFENAIKWSEKAVELGDGEVVEQLKKELEGYKKGKPWRELQETEEKPEPSRGGGSFEL
jgi:tetratricopeptide (TPR) repeat protein